MIFVSPEISKENIGLPDRKDGDILIYSIFQIGLVFLPERALDMTFV
jgi:hypothetical protein